MYKKSVIVFLCLMGLCSYAFGISAMDWEIPAWHAYQDDWVGNSNGGTDWDDQNNWVLAAHPSEAPDTIFPIDSRVWACIEAKTPGPNVVGDVCCVRLSIMPWSWSGAPSPFVMTISETAGEVNCGVMIGLADKAGYNSEIAGYPQLDVNGGHIFTPGIPNVIDWNTTPPTIDSGMPWWPGEGLWIGGSRSSFSGGVGDGLSPCYGVVNVNAGFIDVPMIRIYYGDVNIFGGLVYHNINDGNAFFISQNRAMNRINVAGGELRLKGDRQEQINYYIGKGRITAYDNHGMLTVALDDGNTVVTAVGDYNAAWGPSPIYMKQNVSLTPTLSWKPGALINNENLGSSTIAHAVYLGTDATAVTDATTASSEFMGYKNYNDPCSYTVTTNLEADTDYFWRIDEYNDLHPDSPWPGYVWRFRTLGGSAVEPKPADQTVGLPVPLQLDWLPGAYVESHTLYFGTDISAVTDATPGNPLGAYIGTVGRPYTLGSLSFDLAKYTDYYWRIDEVNGPNTWKSDTWMFRNTNYFVVDDFNSYETSEDMNVKWVSGYDLAPSCYVYAQAGLQWSALGGRLSFYYNNTATPYFSEARFITNSGSGSDWTGGGALPSADPIVAVAIGYQGNGTNTADPDYDNMYMGIEDSDGSFDMVLNPDANATRDVFGWSEWKVALSDLGVPSPMDQASIKYFYVGVGERCGGSPGGYGTILFDDVRLYQKSCEPDLNSIVGDFTRDCAVNYSDLDMLVADWLATGSTINLTMTAPVDNYIARYNFDEAGGTTVADVCGTYGAALVFADGITVDDAKLWNTTGGYDGGGCINLIMNSVTVVQVPTAAFDTANAAGAMTIMGWVKMDYFAPTDWWPRMISAWEPNDGAIAEEILEIECPTPRPPSNDSGPTVRSHWGRINEGLSTDGDANDATSAQMRNENFANQWNHFAFVFNGSTDKMRIYHNGYQVADSNFTVPMMTHPASLFLLGCRAIDNAGEQHWIGSLDDFRVYKREVSAAEIAYIGSRNTGVYDIPLASVANINTSGTTQRVNFGDYAYMAQQWLQQSQWP